MRLAVALCVVLSGCASQPLYLMPSHLLYYAGEDFVTDGHYQYFPAGYNLIVQKCNYMMGPDKQWVEPKCGAISRVAAAPGQGQEVWQFELRQKVRSGVGIPYGRMPFDIAVAGTREQCEEIRQKVSRRGTPTEPCKGPAWFQRQ